MELASSLVGVAAAIVIQIIFHRLTHPKRELRYAVVPLDQAAGTWRVLIWSRARADIPSSLYDSGLPIVFRFDPPVAPGPVETTLRGTPVWNAGELLMEPRLLHVDFLASADFYTRQQFNVSVERNLIDVPIIEDRSFPSTSQTGQIRAVQRSKARARLTVRSISVSILVVGLLLFTVGLALGLGGVEPLGTALGGTSLIVIPLGLVTLAIDAVRRLVLRRTR